MLVTIPEVTPAEAPADGGEVKKLRVQRLNLLNVTHVIRTVHSSGREGAHVHFVGGGQVDLFNEQATAFLKLWDEYAVKPPPQEQTDASTEETPKRREFVLGMGT